MGAHSTNGSICCVVTWPDLGQLGLVTAPGGGVYRLAQIDADDDAHAWLLLRR